eukprot:1971733-Pyramimonas_sp.AAC.1
MVLLGALPWGGNSAFREPTKDPRRRAARPSPDDKRPRPVRCQEFLWHDRVAHPRQRGSDVRSSSARTSS